ncbi:MAG: methyltransferase domain-containing protein [Granulosicoccus sp.]|nr:methyltransferase domain-containing protein [Granulosicoccus sp.]
MLDEGQYSAESIAQYELIYGKDFVSPGGADMARKLIESMQLPAGAHVLDIGCGLGGSAFMMAKQFGLRVDAVDLSRNMIEQAQQRQREYGLQQSISFELKDCLHIDSKDRYDAVYSRDVFLHIDNKAELFTVITDALKPGAQLLFTDYTCGPKPWSLEFSAYVSERGYHLRTVDEYATLVQRAGLSLVDSSNVSDAFLDILHGEKQSIAQLPISAAERASLIESRQRKIEHVIAAEHQWGLIRAVKEHASP